MFVAVPLLQYVLVTPEPSANLGEERATVDWQFVEVLLYALCLLLSQNYCFLLLLLLLILLLLLLFSVGDILFFFFFFSPVCLEVLVFWFPNHRATMYCVYLLLLLLLFSLLSVGPALLSHFVSVVTREGVSVPHSLLVTHRHQHFPILYVRPAR